MVKYLQKLGKSLMLPVACLPVAGILLGIGYWIDPTGWGANNVIAAFMINSGKALIDNMGVLFAIGVGIGMTDDNDGTGALAGLVSWLLITKLLSVESVAFLKKITIDQVDPAFSSIKNQFIGIVAGLIGAACYNKFKDTKLPDFLGFFSGKRCVAIVTAGASIVVTIVLFFVWPLIYGGLVDFGKAIISTGAFGAGIYTFLNRLLIPFGLHHALNSVFWFDVAGINDVTNFWSGMGEYGKTGMYLVGFFPFMMFGLPGASLAMYRSVKKERRKEVQGLYTSGALSSWFTGITEPLEFSFMFMAPALYFVYALLGGITTFICVSLPVRVGFNFSAGFVDWFLSFKSPMAQNPWYIIPIGLIVGVIYYIVFRVLIKVFNFKVPGREETTNETKVVLADNNYTAMAEKIMEGIGGKENVASIDYCITRLRLEVKDYTVINEKVIKQAGVAGIIRPGKTSVQVVIGTQVQFVADEFKKLCN